MTTQMTPRERQEQESIAQEQCKKCGRGCRLKNQIGLCLLGPQPPVQEKEEIPEYGYLFLNCPNKNCDQWEEIPDDMPRDKVQAFEFNCEYNEKAAFKCLNCGTEGIKGEYITEKDPGE